MPTLWWWWWRGQQQWKEKLTEEAQHKYQKCHEHRPGNSSPSREIDIFSWGAYHSLAKPDKNLINTLVE